MQIRPLHDRVIIKRLEAETTTAFGIVIPDTAGEKPDQGEVIAVGPGKRDEAGRLVAMVVKVSSSASTPARPSRSTAKSSS